MSFPGITARLSALVSDIESATAKVETQAERVRSAVADIEASTKRAETAVSERMDRAAKRARRGQREVENIVDQMLEKTGSAFDDLRHALESSSNVFQEELNEQLDLLELAGTTVDDIIKKFGDAEIEGKSLREFLQGADFGQFQRQIQELMQGLRKGTVEVGQLLEFLNERGGRFGKTVAGWIRALQEGSISLERFKKLIEGLQEQFDGTDFDELLEEIEDAVDSGRI